MALINKIQIIERKRLEDSRGWFLKVIDGKEENLPPHTGEIYITSAIENSARGSHYHIKATEWFTLIQGQAILTLEDIESKEAFELTLDAKSPQTIMIPPKIAHSFLNKSKEDFILIAYTDELYDPSDTIVYQSKTGK